MLGEKWVERLWEWYGKRVANRKKLLSEVNALLLEDPRELARYYVEPDVQKDNPANVISETEDADPEDFLFRVPAYKWIDSFLGEPRTTRDGRHVAFILSDAGMGKSSLLAMLRMTAAQGVWPGINFRLLKLGETSLDDITSCEFPFETVLLLDSLDEDPDAFGRVEERLIELLKATTRFRQVIVTCRTQFFPQGSYEMVGGRFRVGGFYCKLAYLSLFSDHQVDTYIRKRFPARHIHRISLAKDIIGRMKSLRMRPMLLAHVDDLMSLDDGKEWTAFKVYAALVSAWLDREERKPNSDVLASDLRTACRVLALHLQSIKPDGRARTGEISPANLSALLDAANAPNVIKNVTEFGGRSLLNRNSEGDYRFAHRSIQEFLVVDCMVHGIPYEPTSVRYTDELLRFYVSWARMNRWGKHLHSANLSDANLRMLDLRGAQLQDADLQRANLTGAHLGRANLRNANLSDARLNKAKLSFAILGGADFTRADLVGANLTGALLIESVFAEADLTGARLVHANLAGADLGGADLTGARLHNANLAGARLIGARVTKEQLALALHAPQIK